MDFIPETAVVTDKIIQFEEVFTDRKPNAHGAIKQNTWTIYVGLSSLSGKVIQSLLNDQDIKKGQIPKDDLDELFKFCEPIKPDYYAGDINLESGGQPVYAFTIVDSHMVGGKHRFGVATIVKKGKNLKRVNATNILTQALKDATSKRNAKDNATKYVKPQLADGDAILNKPEVIDREIKALFAKNSFIQRKIDGTRCLMMLDEGEVDAYSRQCKPLVIGRRMAEEVKTLLKALTSSGIKPILDGELYIHGHPLNEINGIVNGFATADALAKKDTLEYHIFDLILTRNGKPTSINFSDRWDILQSHADLFGEHLQLVDTIKPDSADDVIRLYNQSLDEGYEGLIMRYNKPYATTHNDRSNMVKLKPLFRHEFPIIGYKSGTGKHANMIIYECEITEDFLIDILKYKQKKDPSFVLDLQKVLKKPNFSVQPKGYTDEEATEIYRQMKKKMEDGSTYFDEYVKGKLATVEFQDVSNDGKPLRAKFIEIRSD